jgi:RNA polymerase sigma factor (sigma-70 family)
MCSALLPGDRQGITMPSMSNADLTPVRPQHPELNPISLWNAAADTFREWRSGEASAIDRLVGMMSPVLWHVVRAYGLSEESAKDVVQSTWLALLHGESRISDPQAIGAWLTITARREAWRTRKRSASSVSVDDEILETVVAHTASAEQHAVDQDGRRRLWAAVASLDERCQRLLRVIAFDDHPDYARIATDLRMPVGSIGPTRGRCLDKLRQTLSRTGGAP